jgi:hypothetical protein
MLTSCSNWKDTKLAPVLGSITMPGTRLMPGSVGTGAKTGMFSGSLSGVSNSNNNNKRSGESKYHGNFVPVILPAA